MNVIRGEAEFRHTAVVPAIVAVGKGFTMTVALPDPILEQDVTSVTDVTVYVFVDAGFTLTV